MRGLTGTGAGTSSTGILKGTPGHFSTKGNAIVNQVTFTFAVGTRGTGGTRTRGNGGKGRRSRNGRGKDVRVGGLPFFEMTEYESIFIQHALSNHLSSDYNGRGKAN